MLLSGDFRHSTWRWLLMELVLPARAGKLSPGSAWCQACGDSFHVY